MIRKQGGKRQEMNSEEEMNSLDNGWSFPPETEEEDMETLRFSIQEQ